MLRKFKALFGAQDMTEGSPLVCLLKFAIPLLIGNLAQLMYTTADAVVVGRFIGDEALSAIGSAMPPYNLFLVIFMGIGAGVMVMVAQYFGAREYDNMALSIGNAVTLIGIISVIVMALITPLSGAILRLVFTPAETFDMANTYMTILFLGIAGSGFYNVLSAILRGMGESLFPLIVLLFTVITNIGLDILFVAGLGMGVAGAAWATLIAQVLASVVCLVKIMTMHSFVKISPAMLRLRAVIVKQTLRLGLPAAFSMAIMFASIMIVQTLVNQMGYMVAAAITATVRLDAFAVIPSQTFAIAGGTFTGQNIGAGKLGRVRTGTVAIFLMCLVFTSAMVASMLLFGRHMIMLFTDTESLIDMCMGFIRIMCPAYFAMVVTQSLSGVMRGAGDQMGPMWISLVTNMLIRVPLSFVIAYFTRSDLNPDGNPNSVFLALLIAMLCGAAATLIYYRAGKWRNKSIIGTRTVSDTPA